MTNAKALRSAGSRSIPWAVALTMASIAAPMVSTIGLAGCTSGDTSPGPAAVDGSGSGAQPAGPTTSLEPVGEPASIRDGDELDPDVLAARMAQGAEGQAEWVDALARLRAMSWLASRYPGRYDMLDIYAPAWVEATAGPNEEQNLELGIYFDEPLPSLVSVVFSRTIGDFVELDVVIEAGEALIRRVDDDRVEDVLPGGRSRGLFTIGQTSPDGGWRIHSVVELRVLENPEEPAS